MEGMEQNMSECKMKDSRIVISEVMMPSQANPNGNVHGGEIMKIMDSAAYAAARKKDAPGFEALCWGDYTEIQVSSTTLLFQRTSKHERVIVAVNAGSEPVTFHFDAQCGRATDLATGEWHDFGGGSEVEPFTTHLWLCER